MLIENQAEGQLQGPPRPRRVRRRHDLWIDLGTRTTRLIGELPSGSTNAEFRRALSLGIDRDQLNETFWLGPGTPGTAAAGAEPIPTARAASGASKWAHVDPKPANDMLDKIGLTRRTPRAMRLRPDGKGRLRLEIQTKGAQFLEYTAMAEMLREHWRSWASSPPSRKLSATSATPTRPTTRPRSACGPATAPTTSSCGHASGRCHGLPGWLTSSVLQLAGRQGQGEPARPDLITDDRDLVEGPGLPDKERAEVAKEIWKIDRRFLLPDRHGRPGRRRFRRAHAQEQPGQRARSHVRRARRVKTRPASRPQTFFFK